MYVKVKVKPESKRDEIHKISVDRFEVFVRAPAERGMANGKVKELLAKYYKLPITKVRLITGHTSPSKIFAVEIAPEPKKPGDSTVGPIYP